MPRSHNRPGFAPRRWGVALTSMVALTGGLAALANCTNDDCARTLTCDDPGAGGGAAASNPGAGGSASVGGSGGEGGGAQPLTCDDSDECSAGECVDGYCCDSACDGVCQACNVAGFEGTCSPIAAGDASPEDCAGVCDGQGQCATGTFVSAFGSDLAAESAETLIDAVGDYVVIKRFTFTTTIGGTTLTAKDGNESTDNTDSLIAKFSGGAPSWVRQIGDHPTVVEGEGRLQETYGVAHDTSNNLFVTGYFQGQNVVAGCNLVVSEDDDNITYGDMFLAKIDAGGNCKWSKGFGDDDDQAALAVTTDADGASYMTGFYQGDVDFGDGVVPNNGGTDAYLAKYDANGVLEWVNQFGGTGSQQGTRLAGDGDSVVVLGSAGSSSINLGGEDLPMPDAGGMFVGKFAKDGEHLWSVGFATNTFSYYGALAIDDNGDVVISSNVGGELPDFGGGDLGPGHTFVLKLAGDTGEHLWSRGFGDGTSESLRAAACDANGNVVIAGSFADAIDLGGDKLFTQGNDDIFLAKLASDGTHLWSKSFGTSTGYERPYGLAINGSGRIYLTASIGAGTDWGEGTSTDSVAIFEP